MNTKMTGPRRRRQLHADALGPKEVSSRRPALWVTGFALGIWPCLFVLVPALAVADSKNNVVLDRYAGDLVSLQNDQLATFPANQFLKAPYTLLYFGAGWCPDCRRFSPSLVTAYNAQPKDARRFEVLLLTMDKTEDGLRNFMRTENMTWPALAFAKMSGAEDLKKFYSGHGIPCLTLIDRQGKVLLQSKSDQDAITVLRQIQDLVRRAVPAPESSR